MGVKYGLANRADGEASAALYQLVSHLTNEHFPLHISLATKRDCLMAQHEDLQ